jgi:hypothetical protein
MEYFVNEEGLSIESQKQRNKLADVRVGKVSRTLADKDVDKLLPFKNGEFPLVSDLDYSSFSKQISKELYFENLPKSIKLIVMKAEQIQVLSNSFKKYLMSKSISQKDFIEKDKKDKLDIVYDWLFLNKMDIGVLEL